MSVIDELLWLLRNGKWHNLEEISEKAALSKFKVEIAVNFLWEYNFIQLHKKARKIRLQPSILEFINKIQRIEKEEALSH
jgi:DNA-binding IclR family transcriptional regulator